MPGRFSVERFVEQVQIADDVRANEIAFNVGGRGPSDLSDLSWNDFLFDSTV
jgi:hypothetical protein